MRARARLVRLKKLPIVLPALMLLGTAGCAHKAQTAEVAPKKEIPPELGRGGGPPPASPDTCNYRNYHHLEAKNRQGPGKCSSDCDCDGERTCGPSKRCQGIARPRVSCNSPSYHWNEAWNPAGPSKCSDDCECDGQRTCSAGQCQGTAR